MSDPAIPRALAERAARLILDRPAPSSNGNHATAPLVKSNGNGAQLDTARRVVLKCAASVRVQPVPWLWRPYLPAGRLVVLDGPPDVAKSLLACDFGARVTTGAPFPLSDEPREPSIAVIVNMEDVAEDTITPRLIAAGADLTRVYLWDGVNIGNDEDGDPLYTIGTDTAALTEALRRVGATFLVVDPLAAALDGAVNTSRDSHVRRELAKLHHLSKAANVTTLVIRHVTKSAGLGSAMNAGGGSIGIIGAARCGLIAVRDRDDRSLRHFGITKANLVPDNERPTLSYTVVAVPVEGAGDQPKIEWKGKSEATADELCAQLGERPDEAEDRRSGDEWLREYLNAADVPAVTVYRDGANAGGWNQKQLWRALKRIGGRTIRVGYGKDGRFDWTTKPPIDSTEPPIDDIHSNGINGINDGNDGDVDVAV